MNADVKLEPRELALELMSATLRDGSEVHVRAISPDDVEAEREFLQKLSPASRRQRFLAQFSTPSDALLRLLTSIDTRRDAAFVAMATEDGKDSIVGACRFARSSRSDNAECAIVVRDDWQGRGLGVLLMRHLIQAARERGILRLYSVDAASNTDMAELGAHLGFTRRPDVSDATQVVYELRL